MSAFRGSSEYFFFTETHVGDNGHVFVHMKLIPSSNSFAVCFRNFNFLATQRVNVLQTVDPRAFKTSQVIRGGASLSGAAARGAGHLVSANPGGSGARGGKGEG